MRGTDRWKVCGGCNASIPKELRNVGTTLGGSFLGLVAADGPAGLLIICRRHTTAGCNQDVTRSAILR